MQNGKRIKTQALYCMLRGACWHPAQTVSFAPPEGFMDVDRSDKPAAAAIAATAAAAAAAPEATASSDAANSEAALANVAASLENVKSVIRSGAADRYQVIDMLTNLLRETLQVGWRFCSSIHFCTVTSCRHGSPHSWIILDNVELPSVGCFHGCWAMQSDKPLSQSMRTGVQFFVTAWLLLCSMHVVLIAGHSWSDWAGSHAPGSRRQEEGPCGRAGRRCRHHRPFHRRVAELL